MKTLGFMSILYGKEYLKESLLSIRDHVDKMVVAYTYNPSHGHVTNIKCPESVDEIHSICAEVLGSKLIWDERQSYQAENFHRAVAREYASGYDLILTIDADEVFEPTEVQNALKYAFENKQRYYGIKGYVNFWRCFDFACYDGFRPIRIENLRNHNSQQNLECPLTIYHFSTAQSETITRYKYTAFGHANELKPNWLNGTFYAWDRTNQIKDLHCVAYNLWNAEPFDKTKLPDFLKQHINYNKELI